MLPSPRLLRRVTNHSWSWEPSPADKPSSPLGLWQGTALYAGAVIGTGSLVLPAIAAETAGPASVLAWLALVLLSFPLALTYAALSRDQPDAAGFAGAIERAFGPRGGAAAGWIFLAQAPTGYVIAALIAGEYAASLIGGGREARFVLGGGLVALAYVLNAAGLRISARAAPLCRGASAAGDTLLRGGARPPLPRGAAPPRPARRGRRRQLPVWLGVESASGTPLRALGVMGTLCAAAALLSYVAGWNIADLLPLSTSSFIATYVLSMAAAMRLLRPPLRYAAAVSLVACVGVLFFAGTLLVWIAGVAACSVGYQWLVARRTGTVTI